MAPFRRLSLSWAVFLLWQIPPWNWPDLPDIHSKLFVSYEASSPPTSILEGKVRETIDKLEEILGDDPQISFDIRYSMYNVLDFQTTLGFSEKN